MTPEEREAAIAELMDVAGLSRQEAEMAIADEQGEIDRTHRLD